jgi:hypothetical protein
LGVAGNRQSLRAGNRGRFFEQALQDDAAHDVALRDREIQRRKKGTLYEAGFFKTSINGKMIKNILDYETIKFKCFEGV